MDTMHYTKDREIRQMLINSIGYGNTLLIIHDIDKGHYNGMERHEVTDTGIVFIYNERTGNLITSLIARPAQIQRYYSMIGKTAPAWLLTIAEEHTRKGFNN